MGTETRTKGCTFEEFCLLVKDGQKADLIDGVIYMASPDNTDANELFMWLGFLMNGYARRKRLGKVYGTRVAFRIGDVNSPEPDLGFVRADRLHLVQRGFVEGPPDLAVEIVSPDSIDRDYRRKREQYRQAGVGEYWIVDEIEQQVTLLRLGPRKVYREVRPRKGVLTSEILAGFWVRLEWLWQDPLPDQMDILTEILAAS
jgi:Uma2 family endonuclease